jgi:hypothetical protein
MKISPLLIAILGFVLVVSATNSRADDVPKLSKDDGPFMVLAYSFRGPDSEKQAQALAAELRKDHELPSFVYEDPARNGDSFKVLVGNCKTTKEAFDLMRQVKKIKAKSVLSGSEFRKGQGLSRAIMTTNPLATIK